jgi:CheY-like chemotaxis protein
VALVDDDAFREALRGALEEAPGFRCSHAFSSAEEAAQGLSSATVPDVVLMDISLPGRSGLEAVVELKARLPAVETLMLTGHPNEALVFQALVAGASGYLLKSEPVRAILEAIEDVRNGSTTTRWEGAGSPVRSSRWCCRSTPRGSAGSNGWKPRQAGNEDSGPGGGSRSCTVSPAGGTASPARSRPEPGFGAMTVTAPFGPAGRQRRSMAGSPGGWATTSHEFGRVAIGANHPAGGTLVLYRRFVDSRR